MQSSVLIAVILPIALGVVMLGLGLSLKVDDFKRVVLFPRAVLVGLFCQMILMPAACFGVAKAFGLGPELAVGLMLLAASPGGATANLFSHLAGGDVALNITLTAVNSVLTLFTLPIIVNFSLDYFLGDARTIALQFGKIVQVFAIVLVPVLVGMFIRARAPSTAERLTRPVKLLSIAFLVLIVAAAIIRQRANMLSFVRQAGLAALAFNVVSLVTGYLVPLAARVPRRQAVAIGMEIGIHNATLAITIASSPLLLNNSAMAIPPALYGVVMFFTAAAFAYLVGRAAAAAPEVHR